VRCDSHDNEDIRHPKTVIGDLVDVVGCWLGSRRGGHSNGHGSRAAADVNRAVALINVATSNLSDLTCGLGWAEGKPAVRRTLDLSDRRLQGSVQKVDR